MEIRELNTFLKVAVLQNFSKAAQQLGYSQSAVTVQMQHLEKELNIPLFERIGKRVYLTEQGKAFVPYANNVIQATQAALKFPGQASAPQGTLRIGGVESVCTALIPRLLPDFYQLCPQVEVVIKAGPTNDLLDLAESNQLDLVLTLDQALCKPGMTCCAHYPEEVIFVTLAHAPAETCRTMPLEELCRQPFLLTENGASYRRELAQLLAQQQKRIRPILEIGNTETIIHLLKSGVGTSFLPRFTVQDELAEGILTQIYTDLPGVTMYHQLFYYQGKWITPQMQIFIDLVNRYLTQNAS